MKIIMALLASLMILGTVGCGRMRNYEITTAPILATHPPATSSAKEFTRAEAEDILREYLAGPPRDLIENLIKNSDNLKIETIKRVDIGTIDEKCGMMVYSGEYGFTVNGSFYGYDKYGSIVGKFHFSWAMVVNESDGVRIAVNGEVKKA